MISAEELKRRLEATRDAFQRSLAQVSSPARDHLSSDDSAMEILSNLDRRSSQLRHIPVSFDDLEAETQKKLDAIECESAIEERLNALEGSLSPINLRRASSQVDSIRQELEELRASQEENSSANNWMIVVASVLMAVGVVVAAAVLKVHFENGNLSIQKILTQAEVLLNYLLQD